MTDLTAVESVFKTSGDGTSLNIDGVSVFEINIADADQGWKIFEAEDSSSMQIANSEVRDTSGTINIFDANTSADMTVTGTTVTGVTGGLVRLAQCSVKGVRYWSYTHHFILAGKYRSLGGWPGCIRCKSVYIVVTD